MSEEELLKKQWKERENLKPTKFYSEDYVKELQKRIDKAVKIINKTLCPNSDYVDYDFGSELLRQELLEVLGKGEDK